jgi:hypothetical protein
MHSDAPDALRPQPTGGLIVTFHEGVDHAAQSACLRDCMGSNARDFSTASEDMADIDAATTAVLLDDSGIAVVFDRDEAPAAQSRLAAAAEIAEVRPEFWMFAIDQFRDTGCDLGSAGDGRLADTVDWPGHPALCTRHRD